jgi:hypothetical protein
MAKRADQRGASIEERVRAAGLDISAKRIERVRSLLERIETSAIKLAELPLDDLPADFDPRWP